MSSFSSSFRSWQRPALSLGLVSALLLSATPALAHHAMGGRLPITWLEGFLTGMAHPMIGVDHAAFIVAVGLLAVTKPQGWLIAVSFVLSAMAGAGLHLTGFGFPGVEWLVAGSLLGFGLLLALRHSLSAGVLAGLGAIAGLCHGYAYGEAIFGAGMVPLVAYLAGFTVIQLVVILTAYGLGQVLAKPVEQSGGRSFQSAGWVICGVGLSVLASQLISTVLPGF